MIANALFVTTVLFLAVGFYLLDECRFLIPFRRLLMDRYGGDIALFGAILFGNILAAVFTLSRRFFLKDTGRKLAHLERQLRSRESISEELSDRLSREE